MAPFHQFLKYENLKCAYFNYNKKTDCGTNSLEAKGCDEDWH